jgi:hypothetical protein
VWRGPRGRLAPHTAHGSYSGQNHSPCRQLKKNECLRATRISNALLHACLRTIHSEFFCHIGLCMSGVCVICTCTCRGRVCRECGRAHPTGAANDAGTATPTGDTQTVGHIIHKQGQPISRHTHTHTNATHAHTEMTKMPFSTSITTSITVPAAAFVCRGCAARSGSPRRAHPPGAPSHAATAHSNLDSNSNAGWGVVSGP